MSNQATFTEPIKKMPRHGMTGTPEYWAWRDIKKRCYNPNTKWYSNYGGRGIKMQESWVTSFANFYKDVGSRPAKGFSIDRKDNNGDYTKHNCRWASKAEQDNNRRSNIRIEIKGVERTYKQWADHFEIDAARLRYYILKGISPIDAIDKCK